VEKDNLNNETEAQTTLGSEWEQRKRSEKEREREKRKKKGKPGLEDKISTIYIAEDQNAWIFTSSHPYTFITISYLYARTFHHNIFFL